MDIRTIDLNLLLVFEAVWLERNVTRAAKRIGLTQSATSSALARLRDIFADPLLVRTSDGMMPTPKAETLAEPIVQSLQIMRSALIPQPRFDPLSSKQTFTLIATDFIQAMLLPSLQKLLCKTAPGIDLIVKPPTGDIPIRALERGEVDIVFAPFESDHAGIYRRVLFKESFVCLARKNHPTIKTSLTLKAFAEAKHLLVSFKGERFSHVDKVLASKSLTRRVALVVPYFHMAIQMVANSDLIMTCPLHMAQTIPASLGIKLFNAPLQLAEFNIYTYWHERTHKSEAHQWFRNQIQATAEP
jgi:DNA-binding transcriptional LysR family regulator